MTTTFKYIDIIEEPYSGKTQKFSVVTKDDKRFLLGEIKWYGPFRKYSFFPEKNTVFESQCMNDISSFMEFLMRQRKIENQSKPSNLAHESEGDKGKYSTNQ